MAPPLAGAEDGMLTILLLVAIFVVSLSIGAAFLLLGAFLAWLPVLLTGGVWAALFLLAVQPFLLDAYIMAHNSMAPTFLGHHQTVVCPHCGGPLIVPYDLPVGEEPGAPAHIGVCAKCW